MRIQYFLLAGVKEMRECYLVPSSVLADSRDGSIYLYKRTLMMNALELSEIGGKDAVLEIRDH